MSKTVLLSVLGLSVLMYALWFIELRTEKVVHTPEVTLPSSEVAEAQTFISPHTGEAIQVTFTEVGATLANSEYDALVLTPVSAASGARYENSDTGITLWNKGDEVTVYKDDVVTFVGQTEGSLGQPDPSGADVRLAALTAHPWLWQETVMNDDTVIVPKQSEAFVLRFDTEGRMSGTTDCNGFGGSYVVTDGTLKMGPFMMTKMYCEGSQEMEFQGMLDEPVTFMFTDAGELVLMLPYDSGSVIFTPKL